uniref:cGMP-dependent protein kinase n=1 Tax=Dunaliella tertiolecta TaxID=3047 RepID=A0A7S3QLD0_DUNTE
MAKERQAVVATAITPCTSGPAPHGQQQDPELRADAQRRILACLQTSLLWSHLLDEETRRIVASHMYERAVPAGELLIQAGETGPSAAQLFVVKSGKFEVLEDRDNVLMRVNTKKEDDYFGEVGLLYDCPRSATVAATTDAVVWVLERSIFRWYVQAEAEQEYCQRLVFLNSVPLLSNLSRDQKSMISNALVEEVHAAGQDIVRAGEVGNKFYIVKEGEAVVLAEGREANRLFKADTFGEACLFVDQPRKATVCVLKRMTVLALDRATFVSVLGPLEALIQREKSPEAVNQRMARLHPKAPAIYKRPTAEVIIRSQHVPSATLPGTSFSMRTGNTKGSTSEKVAVGHLDEVLELQGGGANLFSGADGDTRLVVIEGQILGEGAFSRVLQVTEESTGRQFAMKQNKKSACMKCPRHLYEEQHISRCMLAHPFCLRQFASFKDAAHLYFLFELMPNGDCMDVLVAEAKVIKLDGIKMWQGLSEELARFYVGGVILAFEYMHSKRIIYRDLKPENILIDAQGYPKLGDMGFAKVLAPAAHTYTFCGTPGYVAPESIIGRGYNQSVDYWTLGVLLYVLLAARQPFASPKTQDPMEIMRRIVSEKWPVTFPPYMSKAAKDLISRLLERRPAKRLGMQRDGVQDIKQHPWFAGFDWAALASRRMQPPRIPRASDGAKRKANLQKAHQSLQRPPSSPTLQELASQEAAFADF